eukprot:5794-Prymnesium_polylepis.1
MTYTPEQPYFPSRLWRWQALVGALARSALRDRVEALCRGAVQRWPPGGGTAVPHHPPLQRSEHDAGRPL